MKPSTSTREQQAALLYEASKLLGVPMQLNSSLDALLTGILHDQKLSACLLLTEQGEGTLRVESSMGLSSAFASSISIPRGEGALGVVFASGLVRQLESSSMGPAEGTLMQQLFERQRLLSAALLPLLAEGRVIGVAFFGSQTQKRFSEESIQELTELCRHLGLAFYNSRRMRDLSESNQALEAQVATTVQELSRTNSRLIQKVRELKTVYELALSTAASRRMEDIVSGMIAGVKELIEVQRAGFFLLQDDGVTLNALDPAFDLPPAASRALAFPYTENAWFAKAITSREPQILNWLDISATMPASWQTIGIRSILVLPLLQGEAVCGLFCAINRVNGLFTQDDVRLLALLTGRVADVLHRLSLDEEIQQRVQDLSVLQEISAKLPNPPVLTDTVAAVGRVAREALKADLCFFFLHHQETAALAMVGGDWDSTLTFDMRALSYGVSEKIPLAQVFQDNEAAFFERGNTQPQWKTDEMLKALDLEHLLYLPLRVEEGCVGVMAIGTRSPRTLSNEQRRLAELVAKQVAIVIERSRLYERFKSANEKLEQINHLKNEFISMVSHELRTPLTTIKGFVSIVLNEETGPLNDQQRHFLETSDRAIDRLTLLVSDLLDISRIEAGQIKMHLRPITLSDVCRRLVTSFSPQLKAQNITLTLQIPENLPLVMADPDRLAQVFDNLISNAIKFTTKGGITVSSIDKGDYVMVSVKDTGSGIPREEHERIFDKFYQIKIGSGYPAKGTGLGLAIVKSIIESHRGKVWVESDLGQGADFRFILPRSRLDAVSSQGL